MLDLDKLLQKAPPARVVLGLGLKLGRLSEQGGTALLDDIERSPDAVDLVVGGAPILKIDV